MKPRFSLSTKILLVAWLNLALLFVVFAVFARAQFRMNLGSFFLLAPTQDRMLSVSRQIALDLPEQSPDAWTALLERYSKLYPARFYLFRNSGEQLAGAPATPRRRCCVGFSRIVTRFGSGPPPRATNPTAMKECSRPFS